MLFNSLHFIIFFPLVVFVFYNLPKVVWRNRWLLIASLYFYGSYKVSYLGLLLAATAIDWLAGNGMALLSKQAHRRWLLFVSLASNLSLLAYFKYYNFFISNLPFDFSLKNIILPIGISFYTFQAMSYIIDVYRKEIAPQRNYLDFILYITFFPQLVAGPIEKYRNLFPQFQKFTRWKSVDLQEALYLIALGFFKKIVIADRIAPYVDQTYNNLGTASAPEALMAIFGFAFQIYCDFSGYSDIARGCAKILGFELSINFKKPFRALNFKDLLLRWHVTLSDWLKNYVFFPLGGNQKGKWISARNYFIVMVLSGFWHGANWTFIVWGVLLGIIIWLLVNTPPLPAPDWVKRLITFILAPYFLILFRARDLTEAWTILLKSLTEWNLPTWNSFYDFLIEPFYRFPQPEYNLITIPLVIYLYWLERREDNEISNYGQLSLIIAFTLIFGVYRGQSFIYFNF